MTACPSDQQLLALLDEQLNQGGQAWIITHLDSCSRCQERLDDLTGSSEPYPSRLPPDSDSTCDLDSDQALSPSRPSSSPAPGPDSTCDLNPSRAVSTNDPSSSLAPDPDSTCDLNPSPAVSTSGPSANPAPGPEATGEFDPDRTVSKDGLGQDDDRARTQGRLASTATAPRARPDSPQAGRPKIPGYEILGKLGEGGWASSTRPGRRV
jgi:hypothetical protein